MPRLKPLSSDGLSTAEALAERGVHRVYFDDTASAQLLTAMPEVAWERDGAAVPHLPFEDFEAFVLSFASRNPDPAVEPLWHMGVPGTEGLVTAWLEMLKGMAPSDWRRTTLGVMFGRFRAAAEHNLVQPESLALFSGANSGLLLVQPQDTASTPGIAAAGSFGGPFVIPPWAKQLKYTIGSLFGPDQCVAGRDLAYYAQGRILGSQRRLGSPFATFLEELEDAAFSSRVAGGADLDKLKAKSPSAQALIITQYFIASEWPPRLFMYSSPGDQREVDFNDRCAYYRCAVSYSRGPNIG